MRNKRSKYCREYNGKKIEEIAKTLQKVRGEGKVRLGVGWGMRVAR